MRALAHVGAKQLSQAPPTLSCYLRRTRLSNAPTRVMQAIRASDTAIRRLRGGTPPGVLSTIRKKLQILLLITLNTGSGRKIPAICHGTGE